MTTQMHIRVFRVAPVVMYIRMHTCMQIWINELRNLIKSDEARLIGCAGLALGML